MAEGLGLEISLARHERKLGIHLGDELEVRGTARAGGEQIKREIGIAAQAVARLAVDHPDALGDELGDDIDAALDHIAEGMGIIGGNVVLLRQRYVEPGAGEEKK